MTPKEVFLADLERELSHPEPLAGLGEVTERHLGSGADHATILDWCEEARERFVSREDDILDLMDCLAGWCGPHARIG